MVLFKGLEYKLLEPWIIKKIEEEKRKQERERPRISIDEPEFEPMPANQDPDAPKRGVEYIEPTSKDKEEGKAYGVRI